MTLTETRPNAPAAATAPAPNATAATAPAAASDTPASATPQPRGLAALLATGDSALVGRLWAFFGLAFGIFAIVSGVLLGAERLTANSLDWFVDHRAHFLFFSLHQVTLVLLCVVPLFLGLAHSVVPRQIGASAVAFPRLAMASFATWLVGSGILIASWLIHGGLAPGGKPEPTELSLLSLGLIAIALAAASLNIAATVILQRSRSFPRLTDVPFFSFAMLVSGGLWLFSFAVLLANLVVMWVDARGSTAAKYGAGENLYDQVSWLFTHQQIFAFALPALGILGDAVLRSLQPDSAKPAESAAGWSPAPPSPSSPQAAQTVLIAKVILSLFAVVAFGADLQRFFNPEFASSPLHAIGPPAALLVVVALLGGYLRLAAGQPRKPQSRLTPGELLPVTALALLLGALVVACLRTVGRIGGVLKVFDDDPDWHADLDSVFGRFDDLLDTTAASSAFHAALLAGLLAAIAGLYMWAPGVLGHKLQSSVGLPAGALVFIGALIYAAPDLLSGFWGQPDLPAASAAEAQARSFVASGRIESANALSFVGVCMVLVGLVLIALDVLNALKHNVLSNRPTQQQQPAEQQPEPASQGASA